MKVGFNMDALNQYLKTLSSEEDKKLAIQMNKIISEALPNATVKLSYGLIGHFQPKQICFFGINKQHIGFYPTSKPIEHFRSEITPYLSGKTTLHFPKCLSAIPIDLIKEISLWNLKN